jgi:hypothetical protein
VYSNGLAHRRRDTEGLRKSLMRSTAVARGGESSYRAATDITRDMFARRLRRQNTGENETCATDL